MGPCVALAASLALGAGCATERPPPEGASAAARPRPVMGDAGTAPPGCGTTTGGDVCDCVDVPLFVEAPNLYFVLDRSGSMADDDKWTRVRVVVGKILRGLGPRANFGATVYPGSAQGACSPGVEIMSVRPGDPPSSSDGPTTRALLTSTQISPFGGTPTSATLLDVRARLEKLSGKTFVILATDGAPNCNGFASCGVEACMPNIEAAGGCSPTGPSCCEPPSGYREDCLDLDASAAAARALRDAGIPVYVLGLPGARPYASVLDAIATAGGTAGASSPKYFAVDDASETAMLSALKKVAAKIVATCELTLSEEPADPRRVNVYFDDAVLPHDEENGWRIEGKSVTLTGAACERVLSGEVLSVRIIAGCPREEIR